MNSLESASNNQYRIGKVARLTGITPDTLRIWERRYDAVVPERSANGGRLYSTRDVARLKLMKQLVDAGDSIGEVARLSHQELEQRISMEQAQDLRPQVDGPLSIAIIGETLAAKMMAAQDQLQDINITGCYATHQEFEHKIADIHTDIIVLEQPTLHPDTAHKLPGWLSHTRAQFVVVIYRFASRESLSALPRTRCSTMRAPVDPASLGSHCLSLFRQVSNEPAPTGDNISHDQPPPARQYNDETLARLASMSSTIKCECPQHLAELLTSLVAFEQYSSECESRNARDAELHAYLGVTTSHARHMIENALTMVIEAEELEV